MVGRKRCSGMYGQDLLLAACEEEGKERNEDRKGERGPLPWEASQGIAVTSWLIMPPSIFLHFLCSPLLEGASAFPDLESQGQPLALWPLSPFLPLPCSALCHTTGWGRGNGALPL